MSEAITVKKATIVDEVSEKLTAAVSVVVVDYRGLTVDEVTRLCKQLRDANVEMKVIKNSILSRAAKKAGPEGMDEAFTRPTVITPSNEDVVAPAKIMDEFAEEAKALEIKGGTTEGKVSSLEEITALAKLPDRGGLLSMLLPVLQASVRNVAYAAKAVTDKEDGDAA